MRKLLLFAFTFCFLFTTLTTKSQSKKESKELRKEKRENKRQNKEIEEEDNDKYDGPDKAVEFEIERTKDLNTGKVPMLKLWDAIQQTGQSRSSSSNRTSALAWIERGPDGDFTIGGNPRPAGQQTSGRIRASMIDSLDPTHNTVWVAGVDGGVWKTTNINNNPANWTLVNDFLANLAVSSMCQDPRPGFQNIMYFCTGESYSNADAVRGIGVFKSTDAGVTWNLLPSSTSFVNGTRILCDFQGNVYLGTRNTGLQRSTDGGTTWTTITPAGIGTSVCDLEISSTSQAGRLHVTTGIFSQSGYSYTDIPSTVTSASGWTAATTPFTMFNQRIELGISGNVLYACPDNASHQVPTIWKSTDGGANWTATPTQPSATWASGQGWYSLSCGINPSNSNEVIVGGLDTWKSTNGGATWAQLSSWATGTNGFYVHADQHNIQWWDGGTKLMFNCDGGVHFSTNGGTTISDRNKGLRLKQFYSVAIHPTKPNYFIAGAQDNGMHRLDHPGLDSSAEVVGGDGCYAAIDQTDGNFQFGSYVYNVYRRSTNGGVSWSTPINNQSTGRFVNPWDYDNNNFKLYACNNAGTFLRWNNPRTGATTDVVSVSSFAGGNVSAVHASPYTANTVYFGTSVGVVVRVDNADVGTSIAGTSINTGSGMPAGYVNSVVTGSDDQHLIVTFTNYGVLNVWATTNGGTTWTAIDGNLPDMPVRWALFNPDTDTKAYIATETGVWETDLINGAATIWTANTSFPIVRTDMIKYRTGDRTIAAGTHGRGIWSAVIPPVVSANPTVTINQAAAQPDPTSVSPVNFTVVFSEPVTGFTAAGVNISGTALPTTKVVTGGPTTYNVAVAGMTACGTVIATVSANAATGTINPTGNDPSTSTDNTVTYCVAAVPPSVTINQAVAQPDPTSVSPINFTIVFSEPVTGFTAAGINLSGTAGGPLSKTLSGSGATYNVAVSGMSSSGTVIATVPANAATGTINVLGNTASTSTDNTVTFNLPVTGCTPPTMNPVANDTLCNGSTAGPYNFTSSTPGATFCWTNSTPSIGLAASGTGNIPAFTAVNATAAPVVATVIVTPSVANTFTNTGSLLAGDLTMNQRLNRPGGAGGTCALPQPFPGTFGTGPYFYDTYTYTNTGCASACVTVNLTTTDLVNANIQSGAWLGSFNPASMATNYIADPYTSTGTPAAPAGITYSFNLAAGASTVIVVWSTNVNTAPSGTASNYTLTIGGLVCTGAPRTFTVTVNPTGQVNTIPDQNVCKGASTTPVNFTSTVPGTVFNWTNNTPAIGLAASGTGNIASFVAQNPGTTPLVATITVTPAFGSGGIAQTQNFNYTGAVQTWVVPAGVTSIKIKSWGGQGNANALAVAGGLGGYAEGTLAVTPGQTLYFNVGGGGQTSVTGGFNGGGNAGTTLNCANANGGGGGGASDVRVAANTLAARAIVAAGGGGAGGNRVAACGRGAGGGGGAGYYGGGGGAGWPGTPGTQGANATGGTQAAGGAGGVTTSTAGATNGTAGALGIGGAGGVEVGSNQGGSSTALAGGTGGGLTGGNGDYVINWTGGSAGGGSSYIGGVTSGITTSGLRTGNGSIQVTYAAGGISCAGTPRTFTITVNPNPALIIVADPGTTICEGDPTLLTVYNSAGFAPVALTQSTSTTITPGSVSCNAGGLHTDNSYWRAYNLAPLGLPSALTVNTVTFGVEQATGGAQPVTVRLYTQTTGTFPGGTRTLVGTQAATVPNQTLSLFTVTLGTPVVVPNTAVLIVELFTPNGQATGRSFFIGSNAAAQTGPSYISAADCGIATPTDVAAIGFPNMHIILNVAGTTGGVGSIATGTFLWSPAAGLSSTTSNPVAASPMNTTTYTVTRTTVPGGCVASASITITVNKRPVVTTQPVSRTNCEGNTATFTVGGTGTGLTYQWQQNTSGCTGGTWTNLTNTAPYSGVNTATLTVNPVTVAMSGYGYRCVLSGTCTPFTPPTNVSNCATLTVNPNPTVAITPAGPVCGGVAGVFGTLLSTGSSAPPVPGTCTTASGAISVAVPDGSAAGIQSTLAVSCVPANATITGMRVNFNMPGHTYVGDMIFNLKAPNGTVLNLVKYMSGTATQAGTYPNSGFVNTTISSAGTAVLGTATTTPITGTWKADLLNGTIPFTIQDPAGFPSTATAWTQLYSVPNGTWTLAMADGGAGDVGTLTSWSIIFDYTTPGSGGGPVLSYVWSPLTGLYTNATATIPYTGTNLPSVYAAPVAQTTYTVRATNVATGCFTDASVLVNYTPPAPTVTPNPVTMCLGDSAVKLKAFTTTPGACTTSSAALSIAIPDNTANGAQTSLAVSCVPVGATVTGISVKLNLPHTYPADIILNLKAPNGQILSLYKHNTNSTAFPPASIPTAGFYDAVVNNTSTTAFSAVPDPFRYGQTAPAGPYKADALNGVTSTGYTIMDPAGFVSNAASFAALYSIGNGTWTLAMADGGPGDFGTLTSWSITINYVLGTPASPAVWTPAAGLFSNAAATIPYVAGTMVDSVWTRPTPAGVYNYQVTVNNLITTTATPTTPLAGGNGNNLVAFNVKNNNSYPVPFNSISSNTFGSGAVTSRVFYKTTPIAGNPGPISVANGWNQFGAGASTVTAGTNNLLISGLTLVLPPGATYGIALDMSGATFPAYTNGTGTIATYSDAGVDIITDGNVGWGGPIAPGTPANNPRNFNGSITFGGTGPGTCTSPARTVVVTVNTPATITTQPVDVTICTDKVATFSVVAAGTAPLTYQWQVSTNGGNNPWTNITNGGVYSGATTATLTITAPPVSMSGYFYRVVVNGAAPCGSVTSFGRKLTVNPLPVILISASPTSLYPSLVANFTSTVTPNAAGPNGYVWLRDGAVLSASSIGINSGIGTGSLAVNVDGLGVYQLRVTDVNGCTNVSNQITIKDSVTAKCFIYPNPTSGTFEVRYYSVTGNSNLPRYLTVYDAKGDRVYSKLYSIGRPYDRMPVDMRAYGKGLYWVEIGDANGNRLAMCRLVIQ